MANHQFAVVSQLPYKSIERGEDRKSVSHRRPPREARLDRCPCRFGRTCSAAARQLASFRIRLIAVAISSTPRLLPSSRSVAGSEVATIAIGVI